MKEHKSLLAQNGRAHPQIDSGGFEMMEVGVRPLCRLMVCYFCCQERLDGRARLTKRLGRRSATAAGTKDTVVPVK
ncbi:MAG: hypothetical protein KF770_15265 [Anaerolineae bacterium]|nr:hypothetical protein [Anaerolineae bacterium]